MTIRSAIFWTHLACGVVVGLVVLMMSVTGLLIAYERQMLTWADHASYEPLDPGAGEWSLERVIAAAEAGMLGEGSLSVTVPHDAEAAVLVRRGRQQRMYVDPYTGRLLGEGAADWHEFFGLITRWHRWFALEGEQRSIGRAITGASNLVFGFLVLSGLYLWLPKLFRKRQFRLRLRFVKPWPTTQAKDFNRHHVYGFWLSLPLLLVILSATVFSYGWANTLVYRAFGEEPPVRRGPPGTARGGDASAGDAVAVEAPRGQIDALFQAVDRQADGWRSISFAVPDAAAEAVSFRVDRGAGGQPQLQATVTLDRASGEVKALERFSDQTPGRRTRVIMRRLHTGEVLGVIGQTLAALACFAAIMLVWTGFRMAWRRLVQPMFRRPTRSS